MVVFMILLFVVGFIMIYLYHFDKWGDEREKQMINTLLDEISSIIKFIEHTFQDVKQHYPEVSLTTLEDKLTPISHNLTYYKSMFEITPHNVPRRKVTSLLNEAKGLLNELSEFLEPVESSPKK